LLVKDRTTTDRYYSNRILDTVSLDTVSLDTVSLNTISLVKVNNSNYRVYSPILVSFSNVELSPDPSKYYLRAFVQIFLYSLANAYR